MKEQKVKTYKGYDIYFLHISYSCPALKLRGFSTELAIERAINRKLKAQSK